MNAFIPLLRLSLTALRRISFLLSPITQVMACLGAFTREFDAFTREFRPFTREFPPFTREFDEEL
jgi:hypothetical protein